MNLTTNLSFKLISVLLVFVSLCSFYMLWWMQTDFFARYEIGLYSYIYMLGLVAGTVLYVSRKFAGWVIIVALMFISAVMLIYNIVLSFNQTGGMSLIFLPSVLLYGGIAYVSTLQCITKCFFSSEEQKQRWLFISVIIVKCFFLTYYFTYIR